VFELQREMGERQQLMGHYVSKGHGYPAVMLPLACLCCGDREYDEGGLCLGPRLVGGHRPMRVPSTNASVSPDY